MSAADLGAPAPEEPGTWPAASARDAKALQVRTQRVTLAVGASVLTVAMALLVAWAGYVPPGVAAIYTGLVVALCAVFYGLIASGASRRFADPSLTVPQLVSAGLAISYVAYEGHEARAAFLALYLVAYMLGVFGLRTRGLVGIALFYEGCYAAVVGLSLVLRPETVDGRRETFRLLALALVLAWMTVLGSYISGLRRRLRETNEQLAQALVRAEALAHDDPLTGCANRRRMMELLAVEARRAQRGSPLSLCLIDLDEFKEVNDVHGHLSGDEVLRQFTAAARAMLRPTDFIARYGGEEFLVGLSQTGLDDAAVVAERVRQMAERMVFPFLPPDRHITVSIGVAQHRPPETIDRTLSRVDQALYEGKRQGRNRVIRAR